MGKDIDKNYGIIYEHRKKLYMDKLFDVESYDTLQ